MRIIYRGIKIAIRFNDKKRNTRCTGKTNEKNFVTVISKLVFVETLTNTFQVTSSLQVSCYAKHSEKIAISYKKILYVRTYTVCMHAWERACIYLAFLSTRQKKFRYKKRKPSQK